MLYIVAKCAKNIRIGALEWVLKFENYTLIWEKHEFMVWKYLAEIVRKIMNKNVQKTENIVHFKIMKFKKKRENGVWIITKLEINSPIIL